MKYGKIFGTIIFVFVMFILVIFALNLHKWKFNLPEQVIVEEANSEVSSKVSVKKIDCNGLNAPDIYIIEIEGHKYNVVSGAYSISMVHSESCTHKDHQK